MSRTTSVGIVGSTEKSGHISCGLRCNIRQCSLKLLAKREDSAFAKRLKGFVKLLLGNES